MERFNKYLFSLANDFAKSLGFSVSPRSLKSNMTLLDRYLLVRQLGRGGMGEIWQAKDTVTLGDVALKFVPQDLQMHEEVMGTVRQMYNLVKDLQHPNICPTYGLEKDPNFGYFLVIKWLPGYPLDYVIKFFSDHGGFPKELVVPILYNVACALDFAHSRQVIHRDIKPSNIFVYFDNNDNLHDVWLIDFGLAAEFHNGMSLYSNSQYSTSGTCLYMPPEQWKGQKQDARTDQYSLAVVAYEMLANELPFCCNDLEILRLAILNDAPSPIANVPKAVNSVLQKALAKNRADRFSSCREFVDSLAVAMEYETNDNKNNFNDSTSDSNYSNLREAVQWCQKAAQKGDVEAQYNLGEYYRLGKGVLKDDSEAVKWYRNAAEQGYAPAQNCLGNCFFSGIGVTENQAEAVQWFLKAAQQDYVPAQNMLGVCFEQGLGITQKPTDAVMWYQKAAEQGYAPAQANLGNCFYWGNGISKNPVEAVNWYFKAAQQGYASAQCILGNCLLNGDGTERNPEEALKWFFEAAQQGNASAEERIGYCYVIGLGVPQNPMEAIKWFSTAAQKGDRIAQFSLGNCLENGIGIQKNFPEAIRFYKMSAEQGYEAAIERLNALGVR